MIKEEISTREGWFKAGSMEVGKPSYNDTTENDLLQNKNFPYVSQTVTKLIDDLQFSYSIDVLESFLKPEGKSVFNVLFFISQHDFHSPKIYAAKILAERYARMEDRFDLRFSFCNIDVNSRKNARLDSGYKLRRSSMLVN